MVADGFRRKVACRRSSNLNDQARVVPESPKVVWVLVTQPKGIVLTESAGEIEKYVTVCLKLDREGVWWRDPDRPETVHYALGRRRLVA
jgi:hypothetical protein